MAVFSSRLLIGQAGEILRAFGRGRLREMHDVHRRLVRGDEAFHRLRERRLRRTRIPAARAARPRGR